MNSHVMMFVCTLVVLIISRVVENVTLMLGSKFTNQNVNRNHKSMHVQYCHNGVNNYYSIKFPYMGPGNKSIRKQLKQNAFLKAFTSIFLTSSQSHKSCPMH